MNDSKVKVRRVANKFLRNNDDYKASWLVRKKWRKAACGLWVDPCTGSHHTLQSAFRRADGIKDGRVVGIYHHNYMRRWGTALAKRKASAIPVGP